MFVCTAAMAASHTGGGGSSSSSGGALDVGQTKPSLHFFSTAADSPPFPVLSLALAEHGHSLLCVRWQAKINQIFIGTSSGSVLVLFDPRFSVKGAVLTQGRAAKREKDPSDYCVVGEIYNPNALRMYR